jgi:hypothetical protein
LCARNVCRGRPARPRRVACVSQSSHTTVSGCGCGTPPPRRLRQSYPNPRPPPLRQPQGPSGHGERPSPPPPPPPLPLLPNPQEKSPPALPPIPPMHVGPQAAPSPSPPPPTSSGAPVVFCSAGCSSSLLWCVPAPLTPQAPLVFPLSKRLHLQLPICYRLCVLS